MTQAAITKTGTSKGRPPHRADDHPECSHCRSVSDLLDAGRPAFEPSHDGGPYCRSGSIASGGARAHCSCDTCF